MTMAYAIKGQQFGARNSSKLFCAVQLVWGALLTGAGIGFAIVCWLS